MFKKLENKRSTPDFVITPELAKALMDLSTLTGRQAGLLLDRSGAVQCAILGEPEEITIPVLSRYRAVPGKLRGLRFIRTTLGGSGIDHDDIADLALLRLDSLSVLRPSTTGELQSVETVHLMPPGSEADGELIPYDYVKNTNPFVSPFNYKDFIEELDYEISTKTKALYNISKSHAAILVGVFGSRIGMGEHMEELKELAKSAGQDILGIITQIRKSVHPRTVVGGGKLREIMITAMIKGADTIIFDNNLTPAQMKAIESVAEINVMDRTQLILEIFAQRAVSNEGKIRVELARLRYFMPYLTGRDDNLSRITGGIDGKGPGETKMELDKRRIAERINFLAGKLKKIESTRNTQRSKRKRNEVPVISIIGYTNAGKSTLLNTLTQSEVYADDRLFATLDTSSKRIRFPQERDVIITDTVGFIRELPQDLMGAFKSTLEELTEADVLLHVVDASSAFAPEHISSVHKVLRELNAYDKPELIVFNKIDLIQERTAEMLRAYAPGALFISAINKQSLRAMVEKLGSMLEDSYFNQLNP